MTATVSDLTSYRAERRQQQRRAELPKPRFVYQVSAFWFPMPYSMPVWVQPVATAPVVPAHQRRS